MVVLFSEVKKLTTAIGKGSRSVSFVQPSQGPLLKVSTAILCMLMWIAFFFLPAEPKPFVEASIILRKPDKSNVIHFKYMHLSFDLRILLSLLFVRYVHVLVQKISLDVDLGFILSLVDFFAPADRDPLLEVSLKLLLTSSFPSISLLPDSFSSAAGGICQE